NVPLKIHGSTYGSRPVLNRSVWVAAGGAVPDLEIEGFLTLSRGVGERIDAHATETTPCFVSPLYESEVPLLRDSICESTAPSSRGFTFGIGAGMPHTYKAALRNVTAAGGAYGVEVYASGGPLDMRLSAKNVIAKGSGNYADAVATTSSSHDKATLTLSHSNYNSEFEFGPGTQSVTDPGSGGNQMANPRFVNPAAG